MNSIEVKGIGEASALLILMFISFVVCFIAAGFIGIGIFYHAPSNLKPVLNALNYFALITPIIGFAFGSFFGIKNEMKKAYIAGAMPLLYGVCYFIFFGIGIYGFNSLAN